MHFSAIIAAALTGLAVASPAHHFHDNQTAQIAYTYSNGTYTKPINVKVNSGTQKLPSTGIVTDVFVAPPLTAATTSSLPVSVRKPMTVPVHPPAAVGYVTCKSN
ncbi:hypothetical protein TrVFT333_002852 [Trichoderma virens FT-333]|nr:hypothetical protein TrVFT333_002852 [Trichoderma virens FT-333]